MEITIKGCNCCQNNNKSYLLIGNAGGHLQDPQGLLNAKDPSGTSVSSNASLSSYNPLALCPRLSRQAGRRQPVLLLQLAVTRVSN